eukprot:COSAG03_NODE_1842_length_3449_cov_2.847463_3_plen_220_part_00
MDMSIPTEESQQEKPKRVLLQLGARGAALATRVLKASDQVPRVFHLHGAAEQARYGRLLLDYGSRGSDDGWLHASKAVDQLLAAEPALRQVEATLQLLYADVLRKYYRLFASVWQLVADTARCFEGLLSRGDSGLSELLSEEEGARLVAEAVYTAGLVLMLLETRIEGALRERLLVAHFRAQASRRSGLTESAERSLGAPSPCHLHLCHLPLPSRSRYR